MALGLLLKLPAFILALWVMYWSLPLSNLFLFIKSWKLVGPRNDVYRWCACPAGQDQLTLWQQAPNLRPWCCAAGASS